MFKFNNNNIRTTSINDFEQVNASWGNNTCKVND